MSTVSSVSTLKELGFKALIKRQPLLSMYIILFVLGWSGLILQMLISQGSNGTYSLCSSSQPSSWEGLDCMFCLAARCP